MKHVHMCAQQLVHDAMQYNPLLLVVHILAITTAEFHVPCTLFDLVLQAFRLGKYSICTHMSGAETDTRNQ